MQRTIERLDNVVVAVGSGGHCESRHLVQVGISQMTAFITGRRPHRVLLTNAVEFNIEPGLHFRIVYQCVLWVDFIRDLVFMH